MSDRPDKDALRDEDPVQLDRGTEIPSVRREPPRREPPAFWQGIIGPGETVLWFGAPDPALAREIGRKWPPLMLALFALGVVLGMGLLLREGEFPQKVLGMAMVVLCAMQIVRAFQPPRRDIGYRHYLLTDRAAYEALVRPGATPRVRREEITAQMPLSATETSVTLRVRVRTSRDRADEPVLFAFNHIHDAAQVRSLIRGIQKANP
ncbi:hypothetical protein [Paenirhodobacter sp.]|uniref:hypothetical protein n=1 Tax=Paenirhodobacter sp. TaxID=1965326 RepID=UPI003B3C088D